MGGDAACGSGRSAGSSAGRSGDRVEPSLTAVRRSDVPYRNDRFGRTVIWMRYCGLISSGAIGGGPEGGDLQMPPQRVERKIYFYRADGGTDDGGRPLPFNPTAGLRHINGLPFTAAGRWIDLGPDVRRHFSHGHVSRSLV